MKIDKMNYNDIKALEIALNNIIDKTWEIKNNTIYSGDIIVFNEIRIRKLIQKYNENLLILKKIFPELTKDLE